MTEGELIKYFLKRYYNTTVMVNMLVPHKIIYVAEGSIPDQVVEDWIINRANVIIKLKYLSNLLQDKDVFPIVPELKKPLQSMKIILSPNQDSGKLEFRFSNIPDPIVLPLEYLQNFSIYLENTINNIRVGGKDRIDSLLVSIGKEIEKQEKIEEYIKKWWNL